MSDITAVILAGGIGKRFTPFVTDKTLFPILGQSLLERTLRMIAQAGIEQAIVATNQYNHDWVVEHAYDFGVEISAYRQESPKGMADALLALKPHLPQKNVLVMNAGDMVEPHLFSKLVEFSVGKKTVLTGRETPGYQPLGYFILDGGKAVGIAEKPGADKMPSNLSVLVFDYFSDPLSFMGLLEKYQAQATDGADDIFEQALTELMQTTPVDVFRYQGDWQKLKFGYHVLDMCEYFLRKIQRNVDESVQIAPTAVINGEVVIRPGAKILDGAIIQGPCYIGENCIIGNNALVRSSVVERDSVIGFSSEIVRSYLGPHSDLHHAYVGDSVLENSVHFGYNAHTANYRFDHKPIKVKWVNGELETPRIKLGSLIAAKTEVGVNASIMPGVAIGTESIIFPAQVVFEAVPDKTHVR